MIIVHLYVLFVLVDLIFNKTCSFETDSEQMITTFFFIIVNGLFFFALSIKVNVYRK